MGYYTTFKVSFKCTEDPDSDLPYLQAETLLSQLNQLINPSLPTFEPDGWARRNKWYSWETDMMDASRQLPGVLIALTGSGESAGDLWRAFFLDGMAQCERPELKFQPFDPGKLRGKPHLNSRSEVNIWW